MLISVLLVYFVLDPIHGFLFLHRQKCYCLNTFRSGEEEEGFNNLQIINLYTLCLKVKHFFAAAGVDVYSEIPSIERRISIDTVYWLIQIFYSVPNFCYQQFQLLSSLSWILWHPVFKFLGSYSMNFILDALSLINSLKVKYHVRLVYFVLFWDMSKITIRQGKKR